MADFFKQLWQRKVVQFGAIYLGAAWVLLQVAALLEGTLELPNWIDQATLVALGLGFPVALILAWAQDTKVERQEPEAPAAANHEKPTIAVLPFVNMSDDPQREYFADGMTEDIITGLSRSRHLSVMSRTSTFAYKGKATNIRAAAEALQADYVVEGSVRPVGERVRMTVQLIRAATGDHVWADKYDRTAAELFDIQDQVIASVTRALGVQLSRAEATRANRVPVHLTAWEFVHCNGFYNVNTLSMRETQRVAAREGDALCAKDPDYAYLHAITAWNYASLVANGWGDDLAKELAKIEEHLSRALALAPDDPYNLNMCAGAYTYLAQPQKALPLCEKALRINPNYVEILAVKGIAEAFASDFASAHESFAQARAAGLEASQEAWLTWYPALALALEGKWEEARPLLHEAKQLVPGYELVQLVAAIDCQLRGDEEGALAEVKAARRINPKLDFEKLQPFAAALGSQIWLDALVELKAIEVANA